MRTARLIVLTALCAAFVNGAAVPVDQNPNCPRMASGGGCAQADVLKYCPKSCQEAVEKEQLLDTLKATVEGLVKDLSSLQMQQTATAQAAAQLGGQVAQLQTENQGLRSEVQALKTSSAQNTAEVTALKTENQALRAEVQAVKTSSAANAAQVSALKAQTTATCMNKCSTNAEKRLQRLEKQLQRQTTAMNKCCNQADKRIQGLEQTAQTHIQQAKKSFLDIGITMKNIQTDVKTFVGTTTNLDKRMQKVEDEMQKNGVLVSTSAKNLKEQVKITSAKNLKEQEKIEQQKLKEAEQKVKDDKKALANLAKKCFSSKEQPLGLC